MLNDSSTVNTDFGAVGFTLSIPNMKAMHVIVIYRNPDGNSQSLMNFLSVTLNNLDLQHTELYILGDFNIDYSNKAILRRSIIFPYWKPPII